jgi:hypothetical protein
MNVQHIAQVVLDKPGRGRVYGNILDWGGGL